MTKETPMTNFKCKLERSGRSDPGFRHGVLGIHCSFFRTACLFSLCCAPGFASDFSGPLQDVQVSLNGTTVSYQVFDPGRSGFATGSSNTPAGYISNPSANGGVVAWLAGTTVHYRIYDPGRGSWMAGSASTPATPILDPVSDSGIVSWLAGNTVYFVVYDPIAGSWSGSLVTTPATSISDPKNSGGMVAWIADKTVWFATYDPVLRSWKSVGTAPGTYIADLEVGTGVAAWVDGSSPLFVLYDASRSAWKEGTGSGFVNSVTIANSTVSWIAGSPGIAFKAGYNSSTGAWVTGIQTPPHSSFLVSPSSGDPPLFVWFTDLSLGGSTWAWNFGDGVTDNHRIPYHIFSELGRYPVVQTVTSPGGNSASTTNNILTDIAPPSGSVLINNGDGYTRSTNVMLTIAATDNSGTVTSMRFSNTNNANWSAWIPYATNLSWILSQGADGLRSVYGQFIDPSGNISVTAFDTITLYTQPNPIVSVADYRVSESTPSLTIDLKLSSTNVFPVAVDYATSDGTATGGLDYGVTSGRLTFIPGQTNRSFTLYVTNDTITELNETLFIVLSNPTNATVAAPGTVTILDDDPATVSFATNTFRVDEYVSQAMISVNLNAPSGLASSINYASSNGTATAGSDYTDVSGTLTFASGVTNRSFVVPIINDTIDEPDETVRLYLSHPTNVFLGTLSNATLIIVDDDPPPASFTSSTYVVAEGAGSVTISVQLNSPFSQTVYVNYTTTDGTAKVGSDYAAASGTLIFPSGQTNQSFLITILSDTIKETNETVHLTLSSLINATPGLFMTATLFIFDDLRPQLLSSRWQTNTGFHTTLSGPPGFTYAIDSSSNLLQWLEITRLTNTTGATDFTDPAAGAKKRFYRARQTN